MVPSHCFLGIVLVHLACGVCATSDSVECEARALEEDLSKLGTEARSAQTSLLQTNFELAPSISKVVVDEKAKQIPLDDVIDTWQNREQKAKQIPLADGTWQQLREQKAKQIPLVDDTWQELRTYYARFLKYGLQQVPQEADPEVLPVRDYNIWLAGTGGKPALWFSALVMMPFVFGVLIAILVISFLLQLLIRAVGRLQRHYLDNLPERPPSRQVSETAAPADVGELWEQGHCTPVETGVCAHTVAVLTDGDRNRLEQLLTFACHENPEETAENLVNKVSEQTKLNLSAQAKQQTCAGLLALMVAAKQIERQTEVERQRSIHVCAKTKLKGIMRKVFLQVKVINAFKKHLMKDPSVEEAFRYTDHGPSLADYKDTRLRQSAVQRYFASEKFLRHTILGFIILYSQVCAVAYALFVKTCFPYLYIWCGPWLLVSRGEAMSIIVLSVLMVLLMTRGLLTRLRRYVRWSTVLEGMVDNPAFSHMVCGAMFVVSASLHVFGHLHGFIPAVLGVVPDYILMGDLEFADYLLFKEQLRANTFTTALEAKTTLPAITGYILIFILCMFWLLSTERVRKSNFELFQYAHGPLVIA
jgi:hypothetical protein